MRFRVFVTLAAGAALVLAGCGTSHRTQPKAPAAVLTQPPLTQGDLLAPPLPAEVTPEVAALSQQWMQDTMRRNHLQRAWDALSAKWQGRLKHDRWVAGYMPITPLPPSIKIDRIVQVDAFRHVDDQVIIRYGLEGTNDKLPWRMDYFITLVKEGGAWHVDYYSPYAPPPPDLRQH